MLNVGALSPDTTQPTWSDVCVCVFVSNGCYTTANLLPQLLVFTAHGNLFFVFLSFSPCCVEQCYFKLVQEIIGTRWSRWSLAIRSSRERTTSRDSAPNPHAGLVRKWCSYTEPRTMWVQLLSHRETLHVLMPTESTPYYIRQYSDECLVIKV